MVGICNGENLEKWDFAGRHDFDQIMMTMMMARIKYKLVFRLLVFILTTVWMMKIIEMVIMMRG